MGNNTITVTSESFDVDVLKASESKPVLVDFWAEWCGPCRLIAPVLEEIAGTHSDKIIIAKVNSDENPEVSRTYEIMSLPTLLVFVNGEAVKAIVGAKPKQMLLQDLKQFL